MIEFKWSSPILINLLSEERVAKMYLSFEEAALADSNVDGIGQVVSDHFMSLSYVPLQLLNVCRRGLLF